MNGYKFDFAVSAQISARVVEEMIRRVVEEQTGKKVSRIEMKMSNVTRGIGPMESNEQKFDGCMVYFESESKMPNNNTFTRNDYK